MSKDANSRNVAQESVRALITREEWDAWAAATWEIATSGTKPDYVFCRKCHLKQPADRVDLMARVNAGKALQEMGFGKPREDSASERGFVLNRTIVVPEGVESSGVC